MTWTTQMKRLGFIVELLTVAVSFTACNDDESEQIPVPETAYVSLYHASPNATGLDVLVDGRQINSYSFDYSESTGYLRFYTGERTLKFTPYDANNTVTDTTVNFEPNNAYSVFAVGEYPNLQTLILEDNSEAPTADHAKIRVVHLSPDAPDVTVSSSQSSEIAIGAQSYLTASEFQEVAAGTYSLAVDNAQSDSTVLDVEDLYLSPGIFYTLVIKGYASPPAGNSNHLSAELLVN
ncbi:DUF4397 domain-containing protein [Marinoscillum furvescens]|uniref:Uncharacterized protein DUF4397 n=1 Tax=Marinoscillum furvescens DSM 4134 TaxID=1122208 RepID=A0A3D9L344_MARFU|nr:DUF4397 domain-containing protein [Marinoscillum furvescens]RED96202.1 uncharacterized protein DUF4397 [Marinoscillum furvescens DSM 4134]